MAICIIHADYLDIIWPVYFNLRKIMEQRIDNLRDKTIALCDKVDELLNQVERLMPADYPGLLNLINEADDCIKDAREAMWR
jgi:hypothetical protein